jgi:hypothetical protein
VLIKPSAADGVLIKPGAADGALIKPGAADGALIKPSAADGALIKPSAADGALIKPGAIAAGPTSRISEPFDGTVVEDKTFVFEEPSALSNVLRRCYVGEVVRVVDEAETTEGRPWVKLALGYDKTGWVEASRIVPTGHFKLEQYRPERVIREELPVAVGMRLGGEGLGAGLLFRYQPFSRLGISASFSGLIGNEHGELGILRPSTSPLHGTVMYAGLTSFLVLWNLSPVFEMGLSRISYEQGQTTLGITAIDLGVGIEWMFNRGAFVGFGMHYVRSLTVDVSYTYAYARERTLTVPTFSLLGSDDRLQQVQPSLTFGYAF